MKTAVEWLFEQLEFDESVSMDNIEEIFNQAKEMQQDQIIHAFQSGSDDGCCMKSIQSAEQYYNETFDK